MIKLDKVTKIFGTGSTALSDITLEIEPGEFVFLVGPSGSGKSTLMRMLIRETLPTSGSIQVNNIDLVKLPNNKVPHLRRKIGVIFQDLKLLVDRTIYENIVLPLEMSNVPHKEAHAKVLNILEQVGISEHKDKYPVQLSGGELLGACGVARLPRSDFPGALPLLLRQGHPPAVGDHARAGRRPWRAGQCRSTG